MSEVGERINPLLSPTPHLFYNMDKSKLIRLLHLFASIEAVNSEPRKILIIL